MRERVVALFEDNRDAARLAAPDKATRPPLAPRPLHLAPRTRYPLRATRHVHRLIQSVDDVFVLVFDYSPFDF